MAGLDWLTARPIAHRALHGGALVENTLGAAAAAVVANYAIETDLQLSADGEVIVFHDDTFDRLTTASGPVKTRTLIELKKIAFKDSGERIPTLGELLTLVAGRTPLVLELKSAWDGDDRLVARVAKQLESYAGPVAAMSFDPRTVEALRKHAPGLPRGIVAERYYRAALLGQDAVAAQVRARQSSAFPFHAAAFRGVPRAGPARDRAPPGAARARHAAADLDGADRGRAPPRPLLGEPDDFRGLPALNKNPSP